MAPAAGSPPDGHRKPMIGKPFLQTRRLAQPLLRKIKPHGHARAGHPPDDRSSVASRGGGGRQREPN